jgi:hypothetical protein
VEIQWALLKVLSTALQWQILLKRLKILNQLSNFEDLSTVQEDTSSQRLCPKEIGSVDAPNGDNLGVEAIDSCRHLSTWIFTTDFLTEILLNAVNTGREKLAERALNKGGALNGVGDRDGIVSVPLIAAARAGREGIVRMLLNRGALDIDLALIRAAGAGHAAVVSLLLDHDRATNDSSNSFWYLGQKFLDFVFDLICREVNPRTVKRQVIP